MPISYRLWGKVLATAEARRAATKELLDPAGLPRVAVAATLAHAHRNANDLKAWSRRVEAALNGQEGDGRAMWLLAKAYVDELTPYEPNSARRLARLKHAFMESRSEGVRLAAVRELAALHIQRRQPKLACEVIESVASQFTGKAASAVAKLREEALAAMARQEADVRRQAAEQAYGRRRSMLEYWQRKLREAEARGDEESVARLTRKIQELEKGAGARP